MSLEIKFCPTCNNILNITKNPPKNKQILQIQNFETPHTMSGNDDEIDVDNKNNLQTDGDDYSKIEEIINKIAKNEEINETELGDFKLEQFMKHKTYQKLDKKIKPNVQTKLTTFFEKLEDSVSAYYFCGICCYSKPIESGTLVASRMGSGASNMYMNMERMKNRVNNYILPYTRNYICTNKNCESHKDPKKREAVMFRVGNSVQTWYTCCECKSSWKGE